MLFRILLASILAAPFTSWAQYVTVGPNGQVVPAGTVVVMGTGGGPALNTPSITLATPANTAGISLADRAGISESAPSTTAVPSTSETVPVYAYNGLPNEAAQTATPENAGVAPAAANDTGRLINDVGPSSFAGAAYASGAPVATNGAPGSGAPSLGELAAKYKAERPQNMRTYTNADAMRLSDSMNVHGANVNPVSAQNTVPPAQTQPSATTGAQASTAPQLSASARPSPGIPAPATQSSSSQNSAQNPESAPQTQESPTTPQVSQKAANQNENEGTRKSLPASSTLLPLFGILGLGFGAVGLWLRKYIG